MIGSRIASNTERLTNQLLHSRAPNVIHSIPRELSTVLLQLPVLADPLPRAGFAHGLFALPPRIYYRVGEQMV